MHSHIRSIIVQGKIRKKVFLALDHEKTPMDISREIKVAQSNISRALKVFENHKLVVCNNPEDHKCRYYQLTKIGKKIRNIIQNSENGNGEGI